MVILVIGFVLIWSFYLDETRKEQPYFYAQDVIDFLAHTTVASVSGTIPYVQALVLNGNITNLDNTLLEQIALSYMEDTAKGEQPCEGADCKTYSAHNLTRFVMKDVIPEYYGIRLLINGTDIYLKNSTFGGMENESDITISAKKMAVVVFNKVNLSDPFIVEVRVWR
ncbi:hypothetical protein COV19_04905 [Candidatus Woesearchaeota archaeon CG10_big_fil_rev_8_21_14_0_10_44_13]|nr:MAG: hypothetical protein COV19_04905 [Candidatus Woesearchaeota archaeon CG10_big_fil_rev_8_21_14_0_10_44_13]